MSHTPEPWDYDMDRNTHDCCVFQKGATEHPDYGHIEPIYGGQLRQQERPAMGIVGSSEWIWLTETDAKRIVECVNACKGKTSEELLVMAQWREDRYR